MVLSIIIVALLAGIAYFHYAQGLFAATISAVCAAIAAFMAFSYHETLAAMVAEHLGTYGAPLMLCGLFAGLYLVLRTIVDNFLPGNVRYPMILDKLGAGLMGIVAAFFCTAIVALAAQELPFGPAVAGYSPYPVESGEIPVDRRFSRLYGVEDGDDAPVFDEIIVGNVASEEAREERTALWLPVDQWFVGLAGSLSDQGSLAGSNTLRELYPDYTVALFGERLGMQMGISRVAINTEAEQQVTVPAVFVLQTDGEGAQFSEGVPQLDSEQRVNRRSVDETYRTPAGKTTLVVRTLFEGDVAEKGFVRFGAATARLVAGGEQYFPIGTLEAGRVLIANKPDDFLITAGGADLVYEVNTESAIEGETLAEDAFLQFKRYARVDLGGQELQGTVTPSAQTLVARKVPLQEQIGRVVSGSTEIRDWLNAYREMVANVGPGTSAPAQPGSEGDQPGQDAPTPPTNPMDVIRNEAGQRNEILEGEN